MDNFNHECEYLDIEFILNVKNCTKDLSLEIRRKNRRDNRKGTILFLWSLLMSIWLTMMELQQRERTGEIPNSKGVLATYVMLS